MSYDWDKDPEWQEFIAAEQQKAESLTRLERKAELMNEEEREAWIAAGMPLDGQS